MKYKLTNWFPGNIKPVREGVYERKSTSRTGYEAQETCFSFWTGVVWLCSGESATKAVETPSHRHSAEQNTEWRGIAK